MEGGAYVPTGLGEEVAGISERRGLGLVVMRAYDTRSDIYYSSHPTILSILLRRFEALGSFWGVHHGSLSSPPITPLSFSATLHSQSQTSHRPRRSVVSNKHLSNLPNLASPCHSRCHCT